MLLIWPDFFLIHIIKSHKEEINWGKNCETNNKETNEGLRIWDILSLFSGEGNGTPLQCSGLENPRDRGAWWPAIYGVTQSWTWLKWLSSNSSSLFIWLSIKLRNCFWNCDVDTNIVFKINFLNVYFFKR